MQDERRRALCLPARSLHAPGQRPPGKRHRRPDALGICPNDETSRDELIKGSFLSYERASALSGTPRRKPEINGAQPPHTISQPHVVGAPFLTSSCQLLPNV